MEIHKEGWEMVVRGLTNPEYTIPELREVFLVDTSVFADLRKGAGFEVVLANMLYAGVVHFGCQEDINLFGEGIGNTRVLLNEPYPNGVRYEFVCFFS